MLIRVLDLDGSLLPQQKLWMQSARWAGHSYPAGQECPAYLNLREWAPLLRLGCSFARFQRFEQALTSKVGSTDPGPAFTFYGSGDFHHVSLALIRRVRTPINLLVLDHHPDWMRGVPFLHCGTWLYHACRLPQVERIFHVGGDVDFDNYYRWLAPWKFLREGKIIVFPAVRRFQRGPWSRIVNIPLRPTPQLPVSPDRVNELLDTYRSELSRRPLYISLDKDVLRQADAIVNWDSGHLRLSEVRSIIASFLAAARSNLAGMDILGDWSPVQVQGAFRRFLHLTEHPALDVDPAEAARCNQDTNLALLATVEAQARKTAAKTAAKTPSRPYPEN